MLREFAIEAVGREASPDSHPASSPHSFPTFLLTHWGKKIGMPIEELIRRQTSDTAKAMGLKDRGLLHVGLKADINVINLDALALEKPVMQYDLPAGGKRLMQRAKGVSCAGCCLAKVACCCLMCDSFLWTFPLFLFKQYEYTIVSGQVVYKNGEATGALPGKLVRCQGEAAQAKM